MPRYMAEATNEQFADAVNGSLNGARAALVLALTVMEAVINFIVDTYRSTFLCFVELVVQGGLAILITAVQELNSFVQSTAGSIRTSIQSDIASANSAIQTAFNAVNKINPFGSITAPQFNIPSLSSLDNITLPTDFEDSLIQLNNSLPSFADLKQKVEAVLDTPFELLKQDINNTFANLQFDSSILPVPEQNTLSFCNDFDTSVVDDLGRDLVKVARIGTLILIALVILLLAGNCLLECYKWWCLKRHLHNTREAWISDPTLYHTGPAQAPVISLSDHNLLMLHANSSHPVISRIVNTLSGKLRMSPSQHSHLQFFFHYVFHPPALACFLIGFFGLLSVQLQLIALGPLQAKFHDLAEVAIKDFSTTIATSINNSMFNQSAIYANDINGRVDVIQNTINNGVFGWVNGTTSTLNDTIVEFYNDIQNAISTVFNGTLLEQPAQDFIKCIIGSKVDAIENALTFLQDNLKVDMPRVNQSVLVLSSSSVEEATQPIAAAAIGSGTSDNQGLVGRLVNSYKADLYKERFMFAIFMALWGIVVFMALCIVFWHSYGQGWVEARRRRRWMREQRVGIDGIVVPFRDAQLRSGEAREEGTLRTLTPLPSPPTTTNANPWDFLKGTSALPEVKEEKNWDSFFQQKGASKNPPVVINRPSKILSLGRFGSEKSDRELEGAEESAGTTWFKRLTSVFRPKSKVPENDDTSFDGTALPRGKNVRDLRISVDDADANTGKAAALPVSAWSVSPDDSQPIPWARQLVPSRKRLTPPGLPAPRHDVSVPSSVYDDASPAADSTPLAVPLHHGFAAPPRLAPIQTRLAPPPRHHTRVASVPRAPASLTPVTRLLTTTHARQSSTVDPFATPFDDEHRVRDTRKSGLGTFAGVAY
jgi:hypothetical protein